MSHSSDVLLGLFLVFVAAQVGAEIAQRLKIPGVVGEIAAGILIGPSVLGWVHVTEPLEVLSEIGAVLLLFSVGLETRVADLRKVGRVATMVGVAGVALPFVAGGVWARLSGFETPKALFIAAAFVATSAGITARVLQELGVLDRIESRVILSAAVIDDILVMLLLGVVTALQAGDVNIGGMILVFLQAVGFIAVIALVGTRVMRHSSDLLEAPVNPLSPLTLSLALCLGLAVIATSVGLAAIIGAFLAGVAIAETRQRHSLEKQLQPVLAFLVPFFFVVTGTQVVLRELSSLSALGTLAIVTVLAVFSKLVGGALAARSLGRQSAMIVGVGMVPRGEVGIIVASLGRGAGVITDSMFAIIVAMALLTSVVAPPWIKVLLRRATPAPP